MGTQALSCALQVAWGQGLLAAGTRNAAVGTWELTDSTHLLLFPSEWAGPMPGGLPEGSGPHTPGTEQTHKLCLL